MSLHELTLFKSLEKDEVHSSSIMCGYDRSIPSTYREQSFELYNISMDHLSTTIQINCYFKNDCPSQYIGK